MKSIADQSTKLGKELGFVGKISDTKEIRLTAMPVDENNSNASVEMGKQLDKNYSSDQQSGFFLAGHVHHGGLLNGFTVGNGTDMEQHMFLGEPSNPDDYSPMLYRGGTERGQSASLLLTPYGVTVYGTGTSAKPNPYGGTIVENKVEPAQNSYILYKQLKQ